jgi:predicted RNase H-like HicB family nuclease
VNTYMFPAVFEAGESKAYVVSFPDLPGCYTQGDTLEEALRMAREALELHLYSMEEEGDRIPEPTPPEKVKIPEGAFVAPVFAYMIPIRDAMANKAVNKTVTLPRWLNDLAEQRKVNFSGLLQTALKQYLGLLEAEHR